MEHINELSIIQFIFSPSGIIIIVMTLVSVGLLAVFMPGGFRKIVAIAAVFFTAGVAIFFLKKQKNKLISDYNKDVDEYLKLMAEKKRVDMEDVHLTKEINVLNGKTNVSKSEMDEAMKKYENAMMEVHKKDKKLAALDTQIKQSAEKLDQGYKSGSAADFRDQFESLKKAMARSSNKLLSGQTTNRTQPVMGVAQPVADPQANFNGAIDIRFGNYRLKGDIS